jgi:hypothetical protein
MLLNIGKRLPSVQNDSPVMNTSGSLNSLVVNTLVSLSSPVVNTLGSLSSPVVNTLRNLKFPVMNTPLSRFLSVLWTSTWTGLQKNFLVIWWQTVQESRLPNVFITGESCLPDVFYSETQFPLFRRIKCNPKRNGTERYSNEVLRRS